MNSIPQYQLQKFSNEDTLKNVWRWMTIISIFAAVGTLYFLRFRQLDADTRTYLAMAWFVGPPIWFWFENSCLLKAEEVESKKERMARFKLSQDTARMCWFGIAAAIVFLARPMTGACQ